MVYETGVYPLAFRKCSNTLTRGILLNELAVGRNGNGMHLNQLHEGSVQ